MNKKQLEKELAELKRKQNSLFAKEQVLKLRTANKDLQLIQQKQSEQDELQNKITRLENLLLKYH